MNKIIDTLLKLGVITTLIVAATTRQHLGYYNFVRWVVVASSIYFAYTAYNKKQMGLVIYFSVIIILFNPLKLFWFQKDTWHIIDWIVSVITFATIYFDWTIGNKITKDDN